SQANSDKKEVCKEIKQLDTEIDDVEEKLDHIMLSSPNVPHESVTIREDEDDNVEVRQIGDIPNFDYEIQPNWDIATNLDIIEFERAAKVAGSRFAFYKGLGARLERALMAFMM